MPWLHTFHVFDTEEAARAAQEALPEGAVVFDVIGTIYEPTGETLSDEEGNQYPAQRAVPGWHVNAAWPDTIAMPPAWALAQVFPETPVRVFA